MESAQIRAWAKVFLLFFITLSLVVSDMFFQPVTSFADSFSGDITLAYRQNNYDQYISQYLNAANPDEEIIIPADTFSKTDMSLEIPDNYEGSSGKCVKTEEEGYIEWKVNIKSEGLYNIGIKYYPVAGKNSNIERELWIDGKVPFSDAGNLAFQRIWKNDGPVKKDNRGNELVPEQVESPMWQEVTIKDMLGYYKEPFKFYFSAGEHTIRLVSMKEPMVIGYLKLFQGEEIPSYSEVRKSYDANGYKSAKIDKLIKIQGEDAALKSDPTDYPTWDRSSPATEPYNVSKIRLNTIGGLQWQIPGQWLIWNFDVPEDGLYKIAIKGRQNITSGMFSTRALYIDGKVPFKEMNKITFNYNLDWQMKVLGDNEPYLFYLKKGSHQLKMEVVMGDLAQIVRETEKSLLDLNTAYRKIIMIVGTSTSTSADIYRDYKLDTALPGVMKIFTDESRILKGLSDKLIYFSGKRGASNAILEALAHQVGDLADRPETIPARLDSFKQNVTALGAWLINIKQQPLQVDYIAISAPGAKLPKADTGFFPKMVHELRAFFASFMEDYDSVGDVYSKSKAITVWVQAGRDQAQILKNMIDNYFTPKTGIPVNMELVGGVLLNATIAGQGPDVALQVGGSDPVNYAARNAVTDLTQFPDFPEVASRFRDSAFVPYKFKNGVYALPETQSFPMLFYRNDILDELKLKVPQTWDDLYLMLADLQKHNLNFGLPISDQYTVGAGAMEMQSYGMFLYQMGGSFYRKDGIASGIDSNEAIDAFKKWTELYTSYNIPQQYDFANRFRTGEMPVGIADYNLYNTLTVFAPEIRGLWGFVPVPGTPQADGTIRHDVPGGGSCCMMIKQTKNKNAAWTFMKWWTQADTQILFGKEMENILGAAARYPTANIEALNGLPWPVRDFRNIMDQWKWVRGIPEVPGGYFTGRHLANAWRQVVIQGDDQKETMLDYARIINEEITAKRKEFGLDYKEVN